MTTRTDHRSRKIGGKRHAEHDARTLQLAKYVDALPPAPAKVDWTKGIRSWPMFLNDELGCCTVASAAHQIESWTQAAHHDEAVITDADILAGYQAVGGYRPGHPDTDQGAIELRVLKYWRKHGFAGGKHKISAFASVDPTSKTLMMDGLYLFGGIYTGFALPLTAQQQDVWEVPPGGPVGRGALGSWGGHAVNIVQADARGVTVITWGARQRASWGFVRTYCDEAYVAMSEDFLSGGKAPNGFDVAALEHDLKLLA
jgi:hypothetical protein